MIDIKLTDTGDLSFQNNDFEAITNETDAINQQLYITLKTALNEFQPDNSLGLRQDNLFSRKVVTDYVKQDIQDAITDQVPNVESIDNIDVDIDEDSRVMNIAITYTTNNQAKGDYSTTLMIGGD